MWIFGYGSLVWRPAFSHVRSAPARIEGWTRRFWQGSPDHRGVPEAPGRVVTLIREPEAHCWGRAYEVAPDDVADILARLDHREQGGYDRFTLDTAVVGLEIERVEALVYVATEDNPNFLGPASIEAITEQVIASEGPSGPNTEYVLRLDEALRDLNQTDDEHVAALAAAVRRRLTESPS